MPEVAWAFRPTSTSAALAEPGSCFTLLMPGLKTLPGHKRLRRRKRGGPKWNRVASYEPFVAKWIETHFAVA